MTTISPVLGVGAAAGAGVSGKAAGAASCASTGQAQASATSAVPLARAVRSGLLLDGAVGVVVIEISPMDGRVAGDVVPARFGIANNSVRGPGVGSRVSAWLGHRAVRRLAQPRPWS
ncbi:hypothetical protein GCM10019060_14540 [Novosphingobium pokkalii]|nr:hypothetical protein GCM10019060_14540 [Novosphingobium pokkalii]